MEGKEALEKNLTESEQLSDQTEEVSSETENLQHKGAKILDDFEQVDSNPMPVAFGHKTTVADLDLTLIDADPNQPRKHFDDDYIESLSKSIQKRGLLQSIAVRKVKDRYIVVDGECRLRALRKLNEQFPDTYNEVPVLIVSNNNDENARISSFVANIKREDLLPIERAEALDAYINSFKIKPKQEDVAYALTIDQSLVSKLLSLNKLDCSIKDIIRTSKQYSLRELVEIAKKKTSQNQQQAFNELQERLGIEKTSFPELTPTDSATKTVESVADKVEDRKTKLLFSRSFKSIKALSEKDDQDFSAHKDQVANTILSSLVCLEKLAKVAEDFSIDLSQEVSLENLKEELQKYIPKKKKKVKPISKKTLREAGYKGL